MIDRSRRIAEQVRRALANIVRERLSDQDFGLLSITSIDILADSVEKNKIERGATFLDLSDMDLEKKKRCYKIHDEKIQ